MSTLNDPEFYTRREIEELALAWKSQDAGIRRIHQTLAREYAEKARIARQERAVRTERERRLASTPHSQLHRVVRF